MVLKNPTNNSAALYNTMFILIHHFKLSILQLNVLDLNLNSLLISKHLLTIISLLELFSIFIDINSQVF